MPPQITNPTVVSKVERLAKATGLTKTAAVERAVDRPLSELESPQPSAANMSALLAQLDPIPDRGDALAPWLGTTWNSPGDRDRYLGAGSDRLPRFSGHEAPAS